MSEAKPPKFLEGEFNWLLLEIPGSRIERKFDRPCIAKDTWLGTIYLCPDMKERHRPRCELIICSRFKIGEKEETKCNVPCLEPEGGRYRPGVMVERTGYEEVKEVLEVPLFASECYSKFVAVNEVVESPREVEEELLLHNVLGSYLGNAYDALTQSFPDYSWEDYTDFSERSINPVVELLDRATMELFKKLMGRYNDRLKSSLKDYERVSKELPREELDYAIEFLRNELKQVKPRVGVFRPPKEALKPWRPKYETEEYAEEYRKYKEMLKEIGGKSFYKLSLRDLLGRDETRDILYDLYTDFLLDASAEFTCEEVAREGYIEKDVCERIETLNRILNEMERHAPIPGLEKEKEEQEHRLREELSRLWDEVTHAAEDLIEDKMRPYLDYTYEELVAELPPYAEDMMRMIEETCKEAEEICTELAGEKLGLI